MSKLPITSYAPLYAVRVGGRLLYTGLTIEEADKAVQKLKHIFLELSIVPEGETVWKQRSKSTTRSARRSM